MAEMTDEEFVAARAFAPFEVAEVFAEWVRRDDAKPHWGVPKADICGGLGSPWQFYGETPEDFGRRCAVALFTLIKEV